ncbi:MAG: hypothetical protein R2744_08895 [Bacteroidales bacterium]
MVLAIPVIISGGCGNNSAETASGEPVENEVVQYSNGTIMLDLRDAFLFNDEKNPDRNTAEWNFMVNSVGRYEVWLSTITQDTMDLGYQMPVIVNFGDKRLEGQPVGDEIILDDKVAKPYFRADSRLGSIYIEDPGHYNIQIISEKVLPEARLKSSAMKGANAILDHIILKPLTN